MQLHVLDHLASPGMALVRSAYWPTKENMFEPFRNAEIDEATPRCCLLYATAKRLTSTMD